VNNDDFPGNPETDPARALAYEQRTANLIALVPQVVEQARLEELVSLILPRLGLSKTPATIKEPTHGE
jgi:hypothetical protein